MMTRFQDRSTEEAGAPGDQQLFRPLFSISQEEKDTRTVSQPQDNRAVVDRPVILPPTAHGVRCQDPQVDSRVDL